MAAETIFRMRKRPTSNDGQVHSIDFVRSLNQTNVSNVQRSLEIGDQLHRSLFAHKIFGKVKMQKYGRTRIERQDDITVRREGDSD